MHATRFLSALLLTTLTTTASAVAAGQQSGPPQQLFTLEGSARTPESRDLVTDAAEEFLIELDPATVAANPRTLAIDLPGHPPLEAVRRRFVEYRPDWKSWSGVLREAGSQDKEKGSIHLGYHGDRLTAHIELEGETYRIFGGGGEESHRLARLSAELGSPSCGIEEVEETPGLLFETQGLDRAEAPLSLKTAANTTPVRLDVLAVYPRAVFDMTAAQESNFFTYIQDSIDQANRIFSNSGVSAYYNLVGIVPVTGTSQPASNGVRTGLSWLNTNPAEVTDLRNAFAADFVTLFIPNSWNSGLQPWCGMGNLPLAGGTTNPGGAAFNQRAFTTARIDCGMGDLTVAHEMGHNFGMRHDEIDDPDDSTDLFEYGNGFLFTYNGSQKATMMACTCGINAPKPACSGTNNVCNRLEYLSSTTIPNLGIVVGNADNDNARVANEQAPGYAAFRTQNTNTPPNATFSMSCSGRTCTFNASGSTDNAAIPSGGYWWDFGEPSSSNNNATGQSVTHTYGNGTTFRVHLVVKDAGGQTDVAWGTANPQPLYEGYVEQANCRAISGWAWDQYQPNTPINVTVERNGGSVSTVTANGFRQDLLNAGKGNGSHGFSYTPLSVWKNGVWHTANVRFTNTSTNLTWLPPSNQIICNVRIFTNTPGPTENLSTAGQVYTVSTRFSSTHSGYITQLGFHRATGETGSNTLRLWTDGGVELANVTTNCSAAGWCWGTLSTPVAINASTNYRVSVNTNTFQSKTGCGLNASITNGPLTAHQGYWMAGIGFPVSSGACNSNFHVDVKFDL